MKQDVSLSVDQEGASGGDQPNNGVWAAGNKVVTIHALGGIVRSCKAEGKVVVLAHGAFDLLHLGHVRHLQAARRHGDVLIVTLTADEFINKGPGRPVFNQESRAEMLAALEYVDWVGINFASDATAMLETVEPDIYIKGQDYKNPEGDITGKITKEREAVEKSGGKIIFTEEITFSSSALINRHFNVFEPHVQSHLRSLREGNGYADMLGLIDSIADYRVLMVGDAIVDEYHYVLPMGKSSKENMIATRHQDSEQFAGGVFAAANHVASFCRQVDVITCLGEEESCESMIRENLRDNVNLTAFHRKGKQTTRKRRYIDPSYMRKLFEVYFMDDEPLETSIEVDLNAEVAARAGDYDLVIVTDFGHGMIGADTIEALTDNARFLAVNAQSNSANQGFNLITKYKTADYVCIDAPEARLAVSDRVSELGEITGNLLPDRIDCDKIIVTQGKHGCVTFEKGQPVHTIPALASMVVDTVGAGDAFLSITAPLVAAGGQMNMIGFIGNLVGALKVQIVGHRKSVDKPSLVKAITAVLK